MSLNEWLCQGSGATLPVNITGHKHNLPGKLLENVLWSVMSWQHMLERPSVFLTLFKAVYKLDDVTFCTFPSPSTLSTGTSISHRVYLSFSNHRIAKFTDAAHLATHFKTFCKSSMAHSSTSDIYRRMHARRASLLRIFNTHSRITARILSWASHRFSHREVP